MSGCLVRDEEDWCCGQPLQGEADLGKQVIVGNGASSEWPGEHIQMRLGLTQVWVLALIETLTGDVVYN